MPVYNRVRQVTAAIQSVLDQQFDDFELIVVDDGSTDGTLEVMKAIKDERLRVLVSARNAGGNAARNRGIEASRAPLLAFLDSDDCYLPDKLGYLNGYFASRPDVDVLLDSFIKRYRPGRDRPDIDLRNPVLDSNEAILEALFNRRIWKATPGIAVRREAALRAGMFDPLLRRRQDFDFILRLAAVARCATTDELLWIKTYSTDAISSQLDSFAESTLSFLERHPEYRDNQAYRSGLAHDLGRHFVRLAKRKQWGQALRDAKLLSSTLGFVPLVRLTVEGAGLFKSRRRAIREKSSNA